MLHINELPHGRYSNQGQITLHSPEDTIQCRRDKANRKCTDRKKSVKKKTNVNND